MSGLEKIDPRRQNRRFDHGMLCPIETKEITQPALIDGFGNNFSALGTIIDRDHSKLVPAASIFQYHAIDRLRSDEPRQFGQLSDRCPSEQLNIIRDMQHTLPRSL
jgi:hypothetical protein